MLIEDLQLDEMAKPVKLCDKCGKQMSKFHYWYKGGWKCKGQGSDKSDADGEKKTKKVRATTATKEPPKFKRPAEIWKHLFKDHPEKEAIHASIDREDAAAKRRERKQAKQAE